ncbi:MAG TPA: CDP-alcohol phosphatidyltransferase family protein, partial [Thermoleophilaceae bacterium]|nr:CDP-alcohol phosphatidyltransferase family protein [Thermoleophilaceae bacterium]
MRAIEGNLTEGEQWSRDLLDRLRAERFTAAAWGRFFDEGFRRARVVRGRRPALVRQSHRWGLGGLVAALPFGPGPVASWAVWWALVDWHLGMVETADGEERPLSGADALTLARLWAAPLVRRHPEPWLVAAGMATDLADGALARRAGPTRLGRDFDSTADTVFLDAALRGAVEQHGLDPRLIALERARLLVGTAVTLASYFGGSSPAPIQRNRGLAA